MFKGEKRVNAIARLSVTEPVKRECLFLVGVAMTSNGQPHDLKVLMLEHSPSKGDDPVLLQDQLIVHPLLAHHTPQLLGTFWWSYTAGRPY